LPDSLDETYERILREIKKPNHAHAHQLLQCLLAAVRPLRVEELAEVLAFDFDVEGIPKLNLGWRWEDQEEAVMSACSSLVIIVKDGDSRIVQFSRFSIKRILDGEPTCGAHRRCLALSHSTRCCIRYLHKHALVSSSDWTISSTVTASRTTHWLDMLLSTGTHRHGLRMRRHGSRMGWNVCLTKTNHTLQRGFGFITKI
jgi:hypothetical protein